MTIHFFIPGDINTLTGGYVYDKIIIEGLEKLGNKVVQHQLASDFPFPSIESLNNCEAISKNIPKGDPIFIDSLAFGPMYGILKLLKRKNPVIAIMHLPLSKNPNFSRVEQDSFYFQENEALSHANCVIAVSGFTKQLIMEYGVNPSKIKVIIPGVNKSSRKTNFPEYPKNLLCIGSYLPGKGQLLLVNALSNLKYLPWTLNMYGILNFNPNYVHKIKQIIKDQSLTDRIFINPQISGEELMNCYLNADLFILPSYFENFSMALNDALNYGIPVITTNGGGIPFSVPKNMGIFISPGNENELIETIKNVLTNPLLYKNLYKAASKYYKSANTWENSINLFHQLIQYLTTESSIHD
jgi:glycosyltransferase involved in cell wall biosynthesis